MAATNRVLVNSLALTRVVFAFASGYVHPDEWFQSTEVTARDVFGVDTAIPWEFSGEAPARSILGAYASSGAAYFVARAIGSGVNGWVVVFAPRLLLCAMSFVVDLAVLECARAVKADVDDANVLFAFSWVTLVLLVRPFSNTMETFAVAACALVALRNTGLNDVARCFAVGVVGMMAVFIRVTSAAFIAPWAWFTVVRAGRGSLARAAKGAASGMAAAALTACACVAVDTMYFSRARGGDVDVTLPTHWVITPLNWFRYNIDTDNLSRHGLHPRYLHTLVNGPIMFAHLWVICLWRGLRGKLCAENSTHETTFTAHTLWASIVLPLIVLSLAPHQEPRFLTPLIVPLCALGGLHCKHASPTLRRRLFSLWIAVNAILACLFGVLHQGGVVPSIRALSKHIDATDHSSMSVRAIFWKTYMPPRSVLAQSRDARNRVSITDLSGASDEAVREILLDSTLPHVCAVDDTSCRVNDESTVVLIAPPLAVERLRRDASDALTLTKRFERFPHLSLDHLDDAIDGIRAADDLPGRVDVLVRALTLTAFVVERVD